MTVPLIVDAHTGIAPEISPESALPEHGRSSATSATAPVRPRPSPPNSMIERMTLILDAFDPATPILSLLELAERTGLPRSTAHRIIDQMIRLRWLAHSSGGYRLGMRPLELGGLAADHSEIRDVVNPLLYELCGRTGLVGHLAVLDGRDVVYLDKVGGRLAANLPTRLGGRLPAHTTAVGKAILSSLDPNHVDATYRAYREPLPVRTPRTIRSIADLLRELEQVRLRHGVAMDNEESMTGISCVAAPLRGRGPATAALSLCGDTRAMTSRRPASMVLEVAREASHVLSSRRHRWL
ncbi:IclR family transcriptional regulator [Streptomyces sp. PSKA54]|uniref:IclR family transcriptional regulator n=1 Tax=Streptomyces himalayensis subsp. aureolus TaxID=2758039 RepID=A0A7W2D2X3_9ACTN|nr:IclR family transcriptional regulator [Streptomyces himalayensis]MBA4863787.1 IclR family transcriptional regulator [Streptomyces himalayensis subsp. aureolus]